jgi:uncharacterized protein YciI
MTKKTVGLLISALCLTILPLTLAHQKEAPASKLVQFHMALFAKGPGWNSTAEPTRNSILHQHFANVMSMLDSGKAVLAGPLADESEVAGIFILRASSADEAKSWVEADPSIKAGLFKFEIHPWWSEDVFKKMNSPLKMNTVYLAFLKRGPNRKPGDEETPEVQELQKAHLANINRLAETKKLVVAGPFGDDGDLRGIFVFRVASLKEAQDLCASDPMVRIDRLRIELHPWSVPAGVLP